MSQLQPELQTQIEQLLTDGYGAITVVLSSGRKVMLSAHNLPITPPRSRMDDCVNYEGDE